MTPEQQAIHDEAARYWAAQPPHSSPLDDDDTRRGMYTAEEWIADQRDTATEFYRAATDEMTRERYAYEVRYWAQRHAMMEE